MVHALHMALCILAVGMSGLASWAVLRSWQRARGLRARLAHRLAPDRDPARPTGWWAWVVWWAQVAVAIVVMPVAALALSAACLALSVGMVLVTLTIAALCGCAYLVACAAVQRTSAPGL